MEQKAALGLMDQNSSVASVANLVQFIFRLPQSAITQDLMEGRWQPVSLLVVQMRLSLQRRGGLTL